MSTSTENNGGLRRFRRSFRRLRDSSKGRIRTMSRRRSTTDRANIDPRRDSRADTSSAMTPGSNTQRSLHHGHAIEKESVPSRAIAKRSISGINLSNVRNAAYSEAVKSLSEKRDTSLLEGKCVMEILQDLDDIEKEETKKSAFLRGVKYLQSKKHSLEIVKLGLDAATPLTNIEPVTSAVFGLVRGVTAIAITFASDDEDLAGKTQDMIERLNYLEACDTLGRKIARQEIHEALILIYVDILEFYFLAVEILGTRGTRRVLSMLLQTRRVEFLEKIEDFLQHSNQLQEVLVTANTDIAADIFFMQHDQSLDEWLVAGRKEIQSSHHSGLQSVRADEACHYLLDTPGFCDWYHASNSRLLMVFGDMGHGKTVAMSYLIDELSRRSRRQSPQPKLCYYYCRDDGTGKAIYIITFLIWSILQQLPDLKTLFFEWYTTAENSGVPVPSASITYMEKFLQDLVEMLDSSLFVVIDGFDECDRASRKFILKLFRNLSERTQRLRMIISSRPQEDILEQVEGSPRIELLADPARDVAIVQKLVKELDLTADVKNLVIDKLSSAAQGCAIWTTTTIKLIEVRKIKALGPMQLFLEKMQLPPQLSELYHTLLERCASDDPENRELATIALRLLAVARRPLSILELAWAAALGTKHNATTIDATLSSRS